MEQKDKVKDFNQRFSCILKKFTADTKPRDSIIADYCTSTLSTNIAHFVKWGMKPTLSKNCQEAIDVEKDLCAIGVIVDDEPAKDSKDVGRRS